MIKQPSVINWIEDFLKEQKNWFISLGIKEFISDILKVKIPNTQIANHFKLEHNLSYKKKNPRTHRSFCKKNRATQNTI